MPETASYSAISTMPNKFTPSRFFALDEIVAQVPGSILWLLAPDALARKICGREAEKRAASIPAGWSLRPTCPSSSIWHAGLADLFLDGLPYGAHTTASDALWAGLSLMHHEGQICPDG